MSDLQPSVSGQRRARGPRRRRAPARVDPDRWLEWAVRSGSRELFAEQILDSAVETLDCQQCSVLVFETGRVELVSCRGAGLSEDEVVWLDTVVRRDVRRGQALRIGDAWLDPACRQIRDRGPVMRSVMLVPLDFRNEVGGAIEIASATADAFGEAEERWLRSLAASVSSGFWLAGVLEERATAAAQARPASMTAGAGSIGGEASHAWARRRLGLRLAERARDPAASVSSNLCRVREYVALLEREARGRDVEDTLLLRDFRELVDDVDDGVARLVELGESLRALVFGEGRESEPFGLAEVAADACALIAAERPRAVRVEERLRELPPAFGRRLDVLQIVVCLLERAFSELEGGGAVRVETVGRGRFQDLEVSWECSTMDGTRVGAASDPWHCKGPANPPPSGAELERWSRESGGRLTRTVADGAVCYLLRFDAEAPPLHAR